MKSRLIVVLAGTHLLALAAGWWGTQGGDRASAEKPPLAPQRHSDRPPREERRVRSADLIAAYGGDDWVEVMQQRKPAASHTASSAPDVSPEQRAAETRDIPGALQEQLDAVNGGKSYDYKLAKALVQRWMREDPDACAEWLGRMEMRSGWGDPFTAFAESLPPLDLLGLINEDWLPRNRSLALSYLATHVGKQAAADVPAILARLDGKDAENFLNAAAEQARVEDARVWIAIAADDPQMLDELAQRWITGPGDHWKWSDGELVPSDRDAAAWQERAAQALAAAAGTPAEEVFLRRLEEEERQSEIGLQLARIPAEPVEAIAALTELMTAEGRDKAKASDLAAEAITAKYAEGLEEWNRDDWEVDLQHSLLGRRAHEQVLADRLAAIASSLPEVLQQGTRERTWREAMMVDPEATLDVAIGGGFGEEAAANAAKLLGGMEVSRGLKADILVSLAARNLWNGADLPEGERFATELIRDDPSAAKTWLARLPAAIANALQEDPE